MNRRALALMATTLLVVATSAAAQDARQIYQRAAPSVVALMMADKDGQPISMGSGFVVAPGLVATNFHVIRGSARGVAKQIGAAKPFNIAGVVAKDLERDLAILKVEGLTTAALAISDDVPTVGDPVFAIGNPQGLEGTLSQGIVSGNRNVATSSWVQITAPISPGSSGGPVLNQAGRAIGVAVATLQSGQNLNFAVSAKHLRELLGKLGGAEALLSAAAGKPASKGSASSVIGGPAIEKVTATNFECSKSDPGNQFMDWECNFSIRNGLDTGISNVRYIVIMRDRAGEPLDVQEGTMAAFDTIRAGLAKRTGAGIERAMTINDAKRRLISKFEVRVLSFEIAK